MRVSEGVLKSQLVEYRKAFRAIMRFHESSWSLYELFDTDLNELFELVEEPPFEVGEKPSNISAEAFEGVSECGCNWRLACCSNEDLKARKSSIYLLVHLDLDLWPTIRNPAESISAISVYGYKINDINGHATQSWDDLEDNFKKHIIDENSGIDEDGVPKKIMPIKVFPNIWSSKNNKYQGDYAIGVYDLSNLIDEDTVRKTIISDIKKLIKGWNL